MSVESEVVDDVVDGSQESEAVEGHDTDEEVEKASKIGWSPKEQFKGDPGKWVSAKEFLKRGEEHVPLLKAELRRMQSRFDALEKTNHSLVEHHRRTRETAYADAMAALRKERASAISELDGERVNVIDDKIAELRDNKPTDQKSGEPPQFFQDWIGENSWVQDEDGQVIAEALAAKISRKHPELVGKREILDKVTEEARAKYPQLFPELSNPRRSQPAAVASGSPAKAKAKKTLADLPQEARDACRDFVRRNIMTEAEYIKDYFGEQA